MAVVDMSIEELRFYMGKNPKPADFDQYWENALDEMNLVDSKIEMTPAEFQVPNVDCFDMYFSGVRGARIYVKLMKPKKAAKPCPAILNFPGYSCSVPDWSGYLHYAVSGFVVALMDCRGQGGKSEDNLIVNGTTLKGHIIRGLDDKPENLMFRQVFLDTAQLAKIIMNMDDVDENKVGAIGGSQGGALTLVCSALCPGIKKLVSSCPFLSDYKRVWEMDLGTGPYSELKDYFRRFDARHEREAEIFTKLGYVDVQHLVNRIKGEVMMFIGLRDDICPPSSQFAVYNKIESPKTLKIYPDFGHEFYPGESDIAFTFFKNLLD